MENKNQQNINIKPHISIEKDDQGWQYKIFPHHRTLKTIPSANNQYRINLVTDSINKGSLYGGVATSIILATLLAEKNNYQLRIITRTEKAIEENIQIILKTNKINFEGYIEFIFADIHNNNWTIDNSPTDYYITTSWWTTASTLKGVFAHQIIYLLQEDERMFYPHGDDHYQCSQILVNSEIQFIVNSELLFQSLINSGLDNIKHSGMFFEPSFVPHYHQTNQKKDCKKKFFFYARPNNLRNLFYLGLEVIEKAVLNNILSIDEWDIYFIGKDLHLLKEQNIFLPFNPIILENLNFPEYIDFISDIDLGLSLMYTPHPSYPPLDLSASGAVVVTNKFGLKNNLSNYSHNIICKNLSVDDLVEGIAEGIKIVENEHLRQSNFDQNLLQKNWHHSFKNILDKLILQVVDMDHQLKETQLELGKTKNELRVTKSQLYETQSQLEETELKLQKIQSHLAKQLSESQLQLEETQSHLTNQLNNTQIQLDTAENTIIAMETSKFWKLRKKWFKFKYLIKTPLLLISTYGLKNILHFLQFLPKEDEIPSSDNGDYQKWLENNYPRRKDLISMAINIQNIDYKPIISLILPTYNTPENFLIEAIESVLNQVYPYWELCIADDCSTQPYVTRILREYTRKDKRIKAIYRDTNGHISLASNSALDIATGEYIALLDHYNLLTPHALYEVVSLLNQHPEADFIYTDEDKVGENNILKEAFFKPDWCPDSFLSRMYTCHLGVYRRSIINEIGGFRVGFEGSQDYDLVLRFTEKTDKIFHIPNILYHWRIHSESTAGDTNAKNYAYDAAQKAISEALTRRGENGQTFLLLSEHFNSSFALKIIIQKEIIPVSDNIDYQQWLNLKYPCKADLISMAVKVISMKYKPVISIIMPTYNTPENFLIEAIESVLNQVYPYWELCIADDCSTQPHVTRILREYTRKDKRIKAIYRDTNGHISLASNSALDIATGEYIALLDHDDLLTPHALYEVVSLLNQHPEADFIYTDEDKVGENNILKEAFFKPDWCPDSFLSRMYTCHLGVYRRSIINEIGGFRVGFEGSQDYDLVLRFTEKTDKIFHIPNILYHWRIHSESTAGDANAKNYAYDAAQKAISEAITRRGENGIVIKNEQFLGVYQIRYEIKEPKLVSIIIPTKDLAKLLHQCLESIFTKTTYPNYEVIVIDNGSVESETFACFDYWRAKETNRFRHYAYDIPFNYSKLNNYGVEKAKGDYLLFLNNDTEVISEDWLEAMVEQSQRKSIGVVGCLLLYPDNTIQHAGVVLGPPGGMAGHGHKFFPSTHGGYFGQIVSINNYSVLTGACMMCRRDVFMEVNGFEEYLEVACNDIDLCLKIGKRGYRNIYLPHVRLYHHESKTRGIDDTPEKKLRSYKELKYMWAKWQNLIDNDPCYNPNLTKEKEDYSINIHKI